MELREKFKNFTKLIDEYYYITYRRSFGQEIKDIDDFFMIMVFSEMMGIENPYKLQMLDMLPALMPRFHEWHKKMGLKDSPFEFFPCSCC